MPGKKLIFVLIDGMTPSTLEGAAGDPRMPTLTLLAENSRYTRATSVFPSLTPVCVSSIVTGSFPDAHRIPHLVWYDRGERRVVEYGSSFAAIRAAGLSRSIRDAIFLMNDEHLSRDVRTVFESLEDAGLVSAAVNVPCYRGRTRHRATIPGVARSAHGPRRFFFYNLFESDTTGARLAVRNRAGGTVDDYAAAVGRWLVTRDGFDFLLYYLSDYDYLSHASGPDSSREGLERAERAVAAIVEAAGGPDAFLERYAFVLCADHGQTHVRQAARLQDALAPVDGILVTASNRAGMAYLMDRSDPRAVAARLDGEPSVSAAAFLEEGEGVLRRDGEEARFGAEGHVSGDRALLDDPDACTRLLAALHNPNAGEVLVSAAPGFEFADLGGGHHAGGGSHGSLVAGDSEVPVLLGGVEGDPRSIVELTPLVLAHFGVEAPRLAHAI